MILRGDALDGVCMDAESLKAAGSSVGTAGLIVMDEDTDLVKVLQRITRFYRHESCGQCTPCREGTGWMEKILTRFCNDDATKADSSSSWMWPTTLKGTPSARWVTLPPGPCKA